MTMCIVNLPLSPFIKIATSFHPFRIGKRKIESNLFSPSKRSFGTPSVNSPIRPLMQESPNLSSFARSPTLPPTGTPSSTKAQITSGNADSSFGDSIETSKPNLIQRILEISEQKDSNRGQVRHVESKPLNEESKSTRGLGRLGRGISNLSWRNNPKFHDDFISNQDRNIRAGRGGRVKQRVRGRDNFSPYRHQQHQNNDWSPVGSGTKDMDSLPGREFKDGNFGPHNMHPFQDRMPMPYNYQAIAQPLRDRSKDHVSSDISHFERQDNLLGDGHDGNAQRFSTMRLPSPNLSRFAKPGQEWQQSAGHNLPYGHYSGQVYFIFTIYSRRSYSLLTFKTFKV